MDKTSMIVSVVLLMAMIIMYAPGVIASNHGRILRSVALWLAIFVSLALFYKNFGPGSPNPLFSLPAGMIRIAPQPDSDTKERTPEKPATAL